MAECALCGKKLGFLAGQTLQNTMSYRGSGAAILVCDDCEPIMSKLKNGSLDAYVTVHQKAKSRNDKNLNDFISLWEQLPEKAKGLNETQIMELAEQEKQKKEARKQMMEEAKHMIVTTGDLKRDYEVLGPVYYQISNKGVFSSSLSDLKKQYLAEIQKMKSMGIMSQERADWGFLYGEWSVGQNDFEAAFFIATEELKKRAKMVGADAIIGMRQDIDMDTNGFAYFYLQMYGTAVKFI